MWYVMKVALEKELLFGEWNLDDDFYVTVGRIIVEDIEGNMVAEMILTLYDLLYTDYMTGDLITAADDISECELIAASAVPEYIRKSEGFFDCIHPFYAYINGLYLREDAKKQGLAEYIFKNLDQIFDQALQISIVYATAVPGFYLHEVQMKEDMTQTLEKAGYTKNDQHGVGVYCRKFYEE